MKYLILSLTKMPELMAEIPGIERPGPKNVEEFDGQMYLVTSDDWNQFRSRKQRQYEALLEAGVNAVAVGNMVEEIAVNPNWTVKKLRLRGEWEVEELRPLANEVMEEVISYLCLGRIEQLVEDAIAMGKGMIVGSRHFWMALNLFLRGSELVECPHMGFAEPEEIAEEVAAANSDIQVIW